MLFDVSGSLHYCGRSMMEGLIRDLQAKEYLYWQLQAPRWGLFNAFC
jgi:hypothetical protein